MRNVSNLAVLLLAFVVVCSSCSIHDPALIPTDGDIAPVLVKEHEDKDSLLEESRIAEQKRLAQQREQERELKKQLEVKIKHKLEKIKHAKPESTDSFSIRRYYIDHDYFVWSHPKGEFETQQEYVDRLNSLIKIDKDVVHYFDVDADLSYNADTERYTVHNPSRYRTPSEFTYLSHTPPLDPPVGAQLIKIVLDEVHELSEYIGSNAYGVQVKVEKSIFISHSLLAFHNNFKNMHTYEYEYLYHPSTSSYTLNIPIQVAKKLDLSKKNVTARVGIKFSYGIGEKARYDNFSSIEPTIDDPIESAHLVKMLACDMDSICFIENDEILSCKLTVD